MKDFWKTIESLNWNGDYNRCTNQLLSTYSKEDIRKLDKFVDAKVSDLQHRFNDDWLDSIEVGDDGWSDLTHEVVGRGQEFYESITVEKLRQMASDCDYNESFAYVFPYELLKEIEDNTEKYLQVQTEDLENWKTKLNAVAFSKLKDFCYSSNSKVITEDDVVRGNDLTVFLLNLKL